MELQVTEAARSKIQELLAKEGASPEPLRFSVVGTRCMGGRGYGYSFHLADGRSGDDVRLASNGLTFLVDPASANLMERVQVDFVDGFEESGFRVTNSHAVGKCPCGHHDLFE